MSEMKERLHTGELYLPNDDAIMEEQLRCLEKQYDYNQTRPLEQERRQKLLREMFAEIGGGCYIEPPLHANWGGHHVHFGSNVYANFGLTLVDDTHIFIGDGTMLGPNVTIATAGHPILPALRRLGYQYNAPVHIGKNCWLGAGSVVTHDLPGGVVAVGVPCRVVRPIGDGDKIRYFRDRRIQPEELAAAEDAEKQ